MSSSAEGYELIPFQVEGRRLTAARWGASGRPLAILLPGAGADHLSLSLQARHLAGRGYTAWVLNARGVGGSDPAPPASSVPDLAQDALALLGHLEDGPAVLVGQSLGSAVAQEMALGQPGRFKHLVLLATWARTDPYLALQFRLSQGIVASGDPELYGPALLYLIASRPFLNDDQNRRGLLRGMFTGRRALPAAELGHQLTIGQHHDTVSRLRALRLPTLVLSGEHDLMIPAVYGEEVAALIPGAEHHLLRGPRSSHLFHWEMAKEVAHRLDRFLGPSLSHPA